MSGADMLARLPGRGAAVLPIVGAGIEPSLARLEGAQAVLPFTVTPSWPYSYKGLLDALRDDPAYAAPYDDSNMWEDAILTALEHGQELQLTRPLYQNRAINIAVDGKHFELTARGNGVLVGGGGVGNPGSDPLTKLLKVANTSTVGTTAARSVSCVIRGLRVNGKYIPNSTFVGAAPVTANDLLYLTGFESVLVEYCKLKTGESYLDNPGSDSPIFVSANFATIRNNIFQAAKDLAVYASGSSSGTLDNRCLTLAYNIYLGCANAWSAKRNYQFVRSIAEYFEACRNGPACTEALITGDILSAGRNVSISSPQFKDMVASCIDARDTANWNVEGMMVGGTFGKDADGFEQANACIVKLDNADRCRVDFVADVVSTDASHVAVKIQNGSVDNVVKGTVKGIATGLLESSGDRNRVRLELDESVTNVGTIDGADSEYRWRKGSERGFVIGPYDRMEGRFPHSVSVSTTSGTLSRAIVGRTHRSQPDSSNINIICPADAKDGDRFIAVKIAGSGTGVTRYCYPDTSYVVARLVNVDDEVTLRYDEDEDIWRVEARSFADGYRTYYLMNAASVPTPPSGAVNQFYDLDGLPKRKDSTGTVTAI